VHIQAAKTALKSHGDLAVAEAIADAKHQCTKKAPNCTCRILGITGPTASEPKWVTVLDEGTGEILLRWLENFWRGRKLPTGAKTRTALKVTVSAKAVGACRPT
jgi:hypothetical protein